MWWNVWGGGQDKDGTLFWPDLVLLIFCCCGPAWFWSDYCYGSACLGQCVGQGQDLILTWLCLAWFLSFLWYLITVAVLLSWHMGWSLLQSPYSFLIECFSSIPLCFYITLFPFHLLLFITSLSPHVLLSLTHSDYASHEPSFPVLLPLVRARFFYLFKTSATACISLTWIYSVLSETWTLAPWEGG
jgi:hypothetical protein